MKQTGKHRVIVINLLVALALTLIVNFSFLLNGNDVRGHRPPPMMTMAPGFIAFQLFYFYAMAIAIVVLNTVRSLSLTRKILLTIAITVLFYLFIPTLSRGGNWNIPLMTGRLYNPLHIMKCSFVLIVSVLYGLIFELIYQKQHITIENEQLKNENLQTRYNMLANQISPHFLFNSLNSLYALIRCNPDQAREFTLTLSRVYRRVLERRKQILSTLAEEIDFTWQYYTLQKIRFDDRIELTTAIDPALRNWRIPSMSLQTLVENAVKHNSITGGNPLHIRIRTEGESFLIENNYTPRSDGDKESLGMGLERIRSVYRFYTEENISISVGDGTFRCRLPLLPPEK